MQQSHRIVVSLVLVGAMATAVTVIGARSSLSAAPTKAPYIITAACHDPVACIHLVNAGGGVAISAQAGKNNGIVGTTFLAQTGLPNANHADAGVVGVNGSRYVPLGHNTSAGVLGLAVDGLGVLGISQYHNGVSGLTFNDGSKTGLFEQGVLGYDRALDTSGDNDGVTGLSTYGFGVAGFGSSASSIGLYGETDGDSGFDIFGYDGSSDGGLDNVGVSAISNGTALVAMGSAPLQPAGKLPRPAILTICGGAPAFIAKNSTGTNLMTLDCKGNLTIAGRLTQPESVAVLASTPSAVVVRALRNVASPLRSHGEHGRSSVVLSPD